MGDWRLKIDSGQGDKRGCAFRSAAKLGEGVKPGHDNDPAVTKEHEQFVGAAFGGPYRGGDDR